MTHDDDGTPRTTPSPQRGDDIDAAARLLRTVATDETLRAVLGIDARPVVDIDGTRIDTPDDAQRPSMTP